MSRTATNDREFPHCVARLAAVPDVTRIQGHPGQVILYPGHYPPGVFVVLSGALKRLPRGGDGHVRPAEVLAAGRRVFLVPDPEELEAPVSSGVEVLEESEILFVPRSLALGSEAVRRCLTDPRLALVSLK